MAKKFQKSIDPTDKHVGSRLRMRRLTLHMSQTALGEAVGLTFQQIQKYELGSNRISSSRLQQFSNILQVQVPFFFEGAPNAATGELGSPAAVSGFLATSDGLSLARSFAKIESSKVRRQIIELIEAVASIEDTVSRLRTKK